MHILKPIAAGIASLGLVISSWFGLAPISQVNNLQTQLDTLTAQVNQVETVGAFNPTGGDTYHLRSSLNSTATSLNLSSFKEPVSDTPYTMAYLNSVIEYGTIDPGTSHSEFISFTGITQNSNGSAVLTGVSRGLTRSASQTGCTTSSTFAQIHSAQAVFIISDSPCHFSEYAVKRNDEAITGSWTVPTPTADGNPATKAYVDTHVNGGTVSTDRVLVAATAGETFNSGAIVFYDRYQSKWYKADADFASTTEQVLLGIAQGSGSSGVSVSGGVMIQGLDSTQGTALTSGARLYLSGTAGATSTTAGTFPKLLGVNKSTSQFYFDPKLGNPQLGVANTWVATSTFSGNIISNSFGGNGSDGALSISSGDTSLNLGSSAYVVKNYSSISITGTGDLSFTSPNASGTVIVLKSQGDCTITSSANPAIDGRGLGAPGGVDLTNASGTPGVIGVVFGGGFGGSGGGGNAATGLGLGLGGFVGSSSNPFIFATSSMLASRFVPFIVGGGGGGGGAGSNSELGGTGGRGGAVVMIQCGGSLNFTSAVSAAGSVGSNSPNANVNQSSGGGGGGGGGTFYIFYNYLTANSGTISVAGGAGGAAGSHGNGGASLSGGGGGGGSSNIAGTAGANGTNAASGAGGTGGTGLSGVFQNNAW